MPQSIRTPRLVIFSNRLQHNVNTLQRLLQESSPAYSFASLCPHLKTHKSVYLTQWLMKQGIGFFKASLNELTVAVAAQVAEVFIAYPLMTADALAVADLIESHPGCRFFVQAARPEHVRILQEVGEGRHLRFSCFIDLDVGMARTGTLPHKAFDLYRLLQQSPYLDFAGLHAYDGHIHQPHSDERQLQAGISMDRLQTAVDRFIAAGVKIERVVVGGTPSFLQDMKVLSRKSWPFKLFFSPGTWILFDTQYQALMPNTFKPAAMILSQIVDQPGENRYVLNMGHKRWAVDQGPIEAFSISGMKALAWSEEHTVVQAPGYCRIGDYVLAAPRHVCSTVNLWEYFDWINDRGEVERANVAIEGRNR